MTFYSVLSPAALKAELSAVYLLSMQSKDDSQLHETLAQFFCEVDRGLAIHQCRCVCVGKISCETLDKQKKAIIQWILQILSLILVRSQLRLILNAHSEQECLKRPSMQSKDDS